MTEPRLSDARVAELRALSEAATPGPWWHSAGGTWIGTQAKNTGDPGIFIARDGIHPRRAKSNCAFITAARNALPALLADLADARQECARLRAALERIAAWDCLNPPDPILLNDLPWLRQLVDDALRPPP